MIANFFSLRTGFRRRFRLLRIYCGGRRSLAAVLVAISIFSAEAAGSRQTLSLVNAAQVASDGIFLDQVLTLSPEAPLPHLRVADAPAIGQVASLSRAQVTQWLQTHAPEYASTNWTGLERIRVSRRTRSLDEVELRELLRAKLQDEHVKQRGELELRLTRTWTSIAVPDEPLTLRIVDLPATGPGSNFIVRFELWNTDERIGNWQITAAAKIWRELPIAQEPLKRGQLLPEVRVTLERRDILALRDAPAVLDLNNASLELVESIAAGQPILARSVRLRPIVRRGQLLDAVIEDGTLTISLKVETLQDGLPGQLIRVRNARTRRDLMGKVINEQTILISR